MNTRILAVLLLASLAACAVVVGSGSVEQSDQTDTETEIVIGVKNGDT